MPDSIIRCTNCGTEIALTDALRGQIEAGLRGDLQKEFDKKEKEITSKAKRLEAAAKELELREKSLDEQVAERVEAQRKSMRAEVEKEINEIANARIKQWKKEIAAKDEELRTMEKKQAGVAKREKELEVQRAEMDQEVARRMAAARQIIEVQIRQETEREIAEQQRVKMEDLQSRLDKRQAEIAEAETRELELRNQMAELEEAKRKMDLEIARRVQAQTTEAERRVKEEQREYYELQLRDRDMKLEQAQRKAEEFKRQLEQGSQQHQGESLEVEVEDILRKAFPGDSIEPVKKGVRGADILHVVKNDRGEECGKILWETKRASNWSDKWVEKLKEDQQDAGAEIGAIVSTALPNDARISGMQGIWVTSFATVVDLALVLRMHLIDLCDVKTSLASKDVKAELLMNYLCGPEFRMRVEGVVQSMAAMREAVQKQRLFMTRQWAAQEKQIEKSGEHLVRMYGSMGGIIGNALPEIPLLEDDAVAGELGAGNMVIGGGED